MKKIPLFVEMSVSSHLSPIIGEVMLWRAVLDQAIKDTFSTDTKVKEAALRFIFDSQSGLEEVAEAAGLEPSWISKLYAYAHTT